jgi:hypothetical protein
MASSVPAVKTALLALLQAHAWPTSAPEVRWGGPTESEDYPRGGELVYFADTREIAREYQAFGRRLDETYTLRLHVDVKLDGDDEQAAELRAWELHDAVDEVLHANHNLVQEPGELTVRLEDRGGTQTNIVLPQAWLARVIVDQAVSATVYINP